MVQQRTKRSAWVELFTDGAALGNPGVGGWAALLRYNGAECELYGWEEQTTNNRMELRAVLEGLRRLNKPCRVTIYSDSQYVVRCGSGEYQKHANMDLWDSLLEQEARHVELIWNWIRGHSGISENERVDRLAFEAAKYRKEKLK